MKNEMININFFEADYGDSLLILFNDETRTNLLIDGGTKRAFRANIVKVLEEQYNISKENYILLTHIDQDHIGGIQILFERYPDIADNVKGIFFNDSNSLKMFIPNENKSPSIVVNDTNCGDTSYLQGKKLEELLKTKNIKLFSNITSEKSMKMNNIKLTFLSPSKKTMKKYNSWLEEQEEAYTSKPNDYGKSIDELINVPFEEDTSVTNASSISVLIEYNGISMLFLGDSFPSDVVMSLKKLGYSEENKLKLDLVKIAHHGSKNNTSMELLNLIKSDKFLISTNGSFYGHPHKETLAKIISTQEKPELIFNYDIYKEIFSEEELNSSRFEVSLKREIML